MKSVQESDFKVEDQAKIEMSALDQLKSALVASTIVSEKEVIAEDLDQSSLFQNAVAEKKAEDSKKRNGETEESRLLEPYFQLNKSVVAS